VIKNWRRRRPGNKARHKLGLEVIDSIAYFITTRDKVQEGRIPSFLERKMLCTKLKHTTFVATSFLYAL